MKGTKKDLFKKEYAKIEQYQHYAHKKIDPEVIIMHHKHLCDDYKNLVDESIFLATISDRLQNKLTSANKRANTAKNELESKNSQLKHTIYELQKTKIGKRATTYVMLFAGVLFVLDEAILEPFIESQTNQVYVLWTLKIAIAFLLKPIEMVVEKIMLKAKHKSIIENSLKSDNHMTKDYS